MMEARAIVKALKEDRAALKELAEELVLQPDVRLAIINAVLRDVATKDDLKELEEKLKAEIATNRAEIQEVKRDMRAMIQIGFTGLGLLIVALGFYLGYIFKG